MMGWGKKCPPYIKYYFNVAQHSDEWHELRCGTITASIMADLLSTKTVKGKKTWRVPSPEAEPGAMVFKLAAQRFSKFTEDTYQSYDMQRGIMDEVDAVNIYSENYTQLQSCGFITNSKHGVTIGFSPDGLMVDESGFVEIKSPKQKSQIETLYYNQVPNEYMIQIQTGLLVTELPKADFIQYSGGMPMYVCPVYPDYDLQEKIIAAANQANNQINDIVNKAKETVSGLKLINTERRIDDICV